MSNARWAIAQNGPVAAQNALMQSASFAERIVDHPSKLFSAIAERALETPGRRSAGTPPLTGVLASARVRSALAELRGGRLGAAEAELRRIQGRIPEKLRPPDLPLLQAAQSFDLARSAASAGNQREVSVELLNAERALREDEGSHGDKSKTLAAEVGAALRSTPGGRSVTPERISLWEGQVAGWEGCVEWMKDPGNERLQ